MYAIIFDSQYIYNDYQTSPVLFKVLDKTTTDNNKEKAFKNPKTGIE